jgi:hypothetical protein
MILSRRIRWAGHVARMGIKGMHVGYWWESQKEKKPLGKPRRRWVDDIKMDIRERGWGGMDWIHLAQDRDQWRVLVNTVMNLRFPKKFDKFLSSCTTDGFSRRAHLHEVSFYYVTSSGHWSLY